MRMTVVMTTLGLAGAHPRKNGHEEQPEEFEHSISIADPPSREVVPPHTRRTPSGTLPSAATYASHDVQSSFSS